MIKKLSIVALLCFCLITLLSHNASSDEQTVQITEINGLVQIQPLGSEQWQKVEADAKLSSGDKVRSFLESSAKLIFTDQSVFILGENSFLEIKDVSINPRTQTSKRELKLNLGTLRYSVTPKAQTAAEYKIHSSTSIVGITGTEGVFYAKGDGKVTENILIEGSTYNTSLDGKNAVFQKSGHTYKFKNEADVFKSEVSKEASRRIKIDDTYLTKLQDLMAQMQTKKQEGLNVAPLEKQLQDAFLLIEKRSYNLLDDKLAAIDATMKNLKKAKVDAELNAKLTALKKQAVTKEQEGADVAEVFVLISKLESNIRRGNTAGVDNSFLAIEQLLAGIEQNQGDLASGGFLNHFDMLQARILGKEKQGFEVSEIKAKLRQSRTYYQQGEFTQAFALMQAADNQLSETIKGLSENLDQIIKDLVVAIEQKKTEGYHVLELEVALGEVQKSIEAELFIKVQNQLSQLQYDLESLNKRLPLDLKAKVDLLRKEISYYQSLGYDLVGIDDLMQSFNEAVESRAVAKVKQLYDTLSKQLSDLNLPDAFAADWNQFNDLYKEKEASGLDIKSVRAIKDQIQTAIDTGDVQLARKLLKTAKANIKAINDNQPPKIQIIELIEEDNKILLKGFAQDNSLQVQVFVNGTLVPLKDDGNFVFETFATSYLDKLSISAKDMSNNWAPAIEVPVQAGTQNAASDAADVKASIEYLPAGFKVSGTFVPGGKVMVNDQEILNNVDGKFSAVLPPGREQVQVVGLNFDGTKTSPITLDVEDKWAPKITINSIEVTNNVAPVLKINPLKYEKTTALIDGSVQISSMGNVSGTVVDLGGTIKSVMIDDRAVDVDETGAFTAGIVLKDKKSTLTMTTVDEAGNQTERKLVFDAPPKRPQIFVNDKRVFANSKGMFAHKVKLTREMKEILVELKGVEGNQINAKRFTVADVFPPQLKITDISYQAGDVILKGITVPQARVMPKEEVLSFSSVEADENGEFVTKGKIPAEEQRVYFVAENIEGKVSKDVPVSIKAVKDVTPPSLYIAMPKFNGGQATISGFAEDKNGIKLLSVNGQAVELIDNNHFEYKLSVKEHKVAEIKAVDYFNNAAVLRQAIDDTAKPSIDIKRWEVVNGMLVIEGSATDDTGVKQINVGKMPIVQGGDATLSFSYKGVITKDSTNLTVTVIDLAGNEVTEGPRTIDIPTDGVAPKGENMELNYGSPIVYISGQVTDGDGIAAIYVNGQSAEIFDDGTFNVKVEIDVTDPVLTLEEPSYADGQVTINGKVALGGFNPSKITVEAEDLSGNRGILSTQEVAPYLLDEIQVYVEGEPVETDAEGRFTDTQNIVFGKKSMLISAIDPFDNQGEQPLMLEAIAPLLELEPLEYDVDSKKVLVKGKAGDDQSGLYQLLINGIKIDFDEDGSFKYESGFSSASLSVIAKDFIGNERTLSKEVKPPDVWPPVFEVAVTPAPAVVGSPVYIEIKAVDSNTGLPDLLSEAPEIVLDTSEGVIPLSIEGEGSNFIATLTTDGLGAATIPFSITGQDKAGNASSEIQGDNIILLVSEDTLAPSFTIEVLNQPLELNKNTEIKVFASEQINELPVLTAMLPSGNTKDIALSKVDADEFSGKLIVPLEDGVGPMTLTLTGGTDVNGNSHDTTEKIVNLVAPRKSANIPLNIGFVELLPDRFILRGKTASEAVVRIEVGPFATDIVAGPEGDFVFEKNVLPEDLDRLRQQGDFVQARIKAHNYAGFSSPERVLDLVLPEPIEIGGEYFDIVINPFPIKQGDLLSFNINVLKRISKEAKGYIYFPDGRKVSVPLSGKESLTGQYQFLQTAPLGPAFFEIVSGDIREGREFEIGLSSGWQQVLNKYDFFNIRVNPDPMIVGQTTEIIVETKDDIDKVPVLSLLLPNGQRQTISLSGSGRTFRGQYAVTESTPTGYAQLILNPGKESEIQRPIGIEEDFALGDEVDALLVVNPSPLIVGEPFNVQLSFVSPINFLPKLNLQLSNGRNLPVALMGGLPGSRFSGQGSLAPDVLDGLARFVLKDDQGRVMDDFPVNIMPPLISSAGINGLLMPNVMRPMDMVNIQINSETRIGQDLSAHIGFIDGTKLIVPLATSQGYAFNGVFQVPDYVPFGAVNVNILDEGGKSLLTLRGDIVADDHTGSFIDVFVDRPDMMAGDQVRLHVEAGWPMTFVPRAVLRWDGGTLNIPMTGSVPGNRFNGSFTVPSSDLRNAVIEIFDDKNFIIGDMSVDHHGDDEGDVIITPMPPVIGQPLSVKIFAPTMVDTAPSIRLNFEDGSSREIRAYGPLPGDEFNGSLDQLTKPLVSIDIVHEGAVVATIPVDSLPGAGELDFSIDLQGELIQGEAVDFVVRSTTPVPFIPRLSVDFNGVVVDVPLNGVSFSREFFGRLNVPATADLQHIVATLFDPQGRFLWQQNYSGQDGPAARFFLNVFPSGADQLDVQWEFIPGADRFELRYGLGQDLSNMINVQGQTHYLLSGLMLGQTYSFEVVAFSGNVELVRSDVIQSTVGQQTRGLNLQQFVEGNTVNLMWTDYPGANEYRVEWGIAPGAPEFVERVSHPGFTIFDLPFGTIQYIRVFALDQGRIIGESREVVADIVAFQSQGGEIDWQPEPPMVGDDLNIYVRFSNDLPFMPEIIVRLQDRDVRLTTTGQLRDFSARLPAGDFDSPLMAVDVVDPNGFILASRAGGGGGFFSGVPITTAPASPIVGEQVLVSVEFPEPINFIPTLYVEFAGGVMQYTSSQAAGGRFYEFIIPPADHYSSLVSMDIEDLNGNIIAERFFDQSTTSEFNDFSSPLDVTPTPLIIGSPVSLSLDTGEQVFVLPRLRIFYEGGGSQEVDMLGAVPGNIFTHQIGSLTDYISSIDVVDPNTNTVHYTWYPDTSYAGPTTATIDITPDPPTMNAAFDIMVQFDMPVPELPWIIMELDDGTIKRYQFSGAPNLMNYSYTIPAGDVTDYLYSIRIEDDDGNLITDLFFDNNSGLVDGVNVNINPDPPLPNQPLDINVAFDTPAPFIPFAFLEFENGNIISNPFPQPAGQMNYSMTVPAGFMEDYVFRMEVQDDIGNILGFYEPGGGGSLQVDNFDVTPDPPIPANSLDITVYFNQTLPFLPQLRITFDSGSTYDYVFPSAAGYSVYSITIPSADITEPIDFISIYDDYGTLIQNGDYFFGPPPAPEYPTGLTIENTNVAGEIKIIWDRVSGVDGYRVYYGQSTDNYTESGSPIEIPDPDTTQAIISGLIDGTEYFLTVESYYAGGLESSNPTELTAFPGSGNASFDHVSFSAQSTTSEIGDPIFVTLTAHDDTHNIVTGFSGNILIDIEETSTGMIDESWILSTEDRTATKGSTATVELFQGVGYFTVDALEPESFQIGTPSQTNDGDLSVEFTGLDSTINTVSSFVVDGKSRAFTGVGSNDGVEVWISAVDSNGNVVTDYTGSVTITLSDPIVFSRVEANGTLSGSGTGYMYTFSTADSGQAVFKMRSSVNQTVNISLSSGDNMNIIYEGAQKYLFSTSGDGDQAIIETVSAVSSQSVDIVIKAALQNNEFAEGYSGVAGASITLDPANPSSSSATVSPLAPVFTNGETTVTVSNSEYETVTLQISGPGPVTDSVDVKFLSTDSNPPEVIDVVVETPWLIRLYFSEEIEETSLLFDTGKYGVSDSGGAVGVDKICWYGDNITINLAEALDLGTNSGVLTIDRTAIKDTNNNVMAANYTNNVLSVPSVDTQGRRLGGADWFEVQPSDASPNIGEEVTVTVFHKNACGYLIGGNAVNATTGSAGSGSAAVSYGSGTVSGDHTFSISGGEGSFTFTPSAAGSFTITVSKDGVTGTVDITVN